MLKPSIAAAELRHRVRREGAVDRGLERLLRQRRELAHNRPAKRNAYCFIEIPRETLPGVEWSAASL